MVATEADQLDELHPAAEVARRVLGSGAPHQSTLYRWWRKGFVFRSGERVKLPGLMVGGKLKLREREFRAFIDRMNAPAEERAAVAVA